MSKLTIPIFILVTVTVVEKSDNLEHVVKVFPNFRMMIYLINVVANAFR